MLRSELARLVHARSHLTGSFVLRSGTTSHEYFDKYRFESDPWLLSAVAEALEDLIPQGVDALAGLELGGVPLATALSLRTGIPARYVRKQAKSYGTCRLAEGGDIEGLRLAVVEDVVTTAGQVIASCTELRQLGAEVASVICVIDREAGGPDRLAGLGIVTFALFTMGELLAANDGSPPKAGQ